MKRCSNCKLEKNICGFYVDKRRNQLTSWCKACIKIAASDHKWRKANPDKNKAQIRKHKLKSKYNLTPELLETLWLLQNKSCAICNRPISLNASHKASKPHVDHCHVTGVVRGLLCLTCNTGLGMFGDSSDLLAAARNYLHSRQAISVKEPIADSASVSADVTIH